MRNLLLGITAILMLLESCKKDEKNPADDPLKSGLIAFYPFNGNALDESGNSKNLTVFDATLTNDRFEKAAKAYSFDGVKSFMKIPGLSKADSLRDFTISLWVKVESPTNANAFLSMLHQEGTFTCASALYLRRSIDKFYIDHQVSYLLSSSSCSSLSLRDDATDPTNNWIHMVVVQRYSPRSQTSFAKNEYIHYLNGVKLLSRSKENPDPISFAFGGTVGCYNNSGNYSFNFDFTKGAIDDIRIYDRALSDEEVTQLYNLDF